MTQQEAFWSGDFGKEYSLRNDLTVEEMETSYVKKYGISRKYLNNEFIGNLDRSSRILEVGCNIGIQLVGLQHSGFQQLYGIELLWEAIELAKTRVQRINIVQGSALDIPFKDGYFDLVFTSGVLIHIAPSDIFAVMNEIHRCTRRYIWGMEYFAADWQAVEYRGHRDVLWKTDYAGLYLNSFKDLRRLKERHLKYIDNDNEDAMFLLEKRE